MGLLTQFEEVQSNDTCEVQFQRILADTEEVRINKRAEGAPNAQSIMNQLNVGRNPEQRKQLASLLLNILSCLLQGTRIWLIRTEFNMRFTSGAAV